jgi:hypothetical protein
MNVATRVGHEPVAIDRAWTGDYLLGVFLPMRKLAKFLPILCFLGGAAVLRADTAPPASAPLSVSEMTKRAADIKTKIEADYQHVLYTREQAKKQKDVIKLSCVNDKLVQMKAQMNIADETNDQLQPALTSGSDDRNALFTTLSTTASDVHLLREQAAACIGEPELYKQEAGNAFSAPDVPDDPTNTPESNAGDNGTEPPGYASPFR